MTDKQIFILPDSMGWGNIVMCLCNLLYEAETQKFIPYVHSSINDVHRGVEFSGFEITSEKNMKQFEPKIFLNPQYFNIVHKPFIHKVLKPTNQMEKLIEKYKHLVEDVQCGIHIRRGAFSNDSSKMGCHGMNEDGTIKPAYFASDSAVEKFEEIVKLVTGRVYIASDSKELKQQFKTKFGDKISFLDADIVLTYDCVFLKNETKNDDRLNCYLDWFLLSKCKNLYLTGGQNGQDMSTFGYTAAAYGGCGLSFIFN